MAMTVESSEKKYPSGGCKFVQEVVNYTMGKLPEARHITALELLENCRQYAIEQYGFLYRNVLENWHIHSGEDIGNIVYELIEAGRLNASPKDRKADFSVEFDLFAENLLRIKPDKTDRKPFIVD